MAISGNQWQSPEAEQLEEHLEGEEERDDETDGLELRRIPVGRGEREFRQEERAVLSTGMCGEGGFGRVRAGPFTPRSCPRMACTSGPC